ncbi:MAB_1171c family putative transporter [Kitasatospora sp. NPDC087315]|uniref:MAB_1171c family putative transporter n=1 Tax=Kitasatospora sp. NPDC087315 TaxID=3364069 RepID=UPI00380383EE
MNLILFGLLPVALIGQCLWRLPAAVRDGNRTSRSLSLSVGALGTALAAGGPAIDSGFLHHWVPGLPVLLRHLFGMGSIACLFDYLYAVHDASPRRIRANFPLVGVAAAVMGVLFFTAVPRPATPYANDIIVQHFDDPWVTAYLAIFYTYLGASMLIGALVFLGGRRGVPKGLARTGVTSLALGCSLGVVYTLHRVMIMMGTIADLGYGYNAQVDALSDVIIVLSILLIVTGLVLAPMRALVRYVRDQYALWRIYPLWSDIADQFPHLVMGERRSRWRELFTIGDRTIDVAHSAFTVRDGFLSLQPYAEPGTARSAAVGSDPGAEALWVRSALRRKAAGETEGPKQHDELAEQDLRAPEREIRWAMDVAAQYTRGAV